MPSFSATPASDPRPASAWHGSELTDNDGLFLVPSDVMDELQQVVEYLRINRLPTLALLPEDFNLTLTADFAIELRNELVEGRGFAIVDRFPIGKWSREEAKNAYWLLSSLIARPVAQDWKGTLVYDVNDSGRPPGNGVRPDKTNAEQNFHTDNSYNNVAPSFLCLLCLTTARSGGISGVISFQWAYDQMCQRYPELASRLREPYYFDRQREHAPGECMTTHHPMISYVNDGFVARLSHRHVVNGHKMAGVPLDERGAAALEAFESILNEPGAARNFMFEPGQMQYLNNFTLGHRRTAYQDWEEPEKKRHLVRLWLRDTGGRGYDG